MPRCLWASGTSAAKPARLPPLENTFSCEEVSTTQRTPSSSRAASNAAMQLVEQFVRQRVARVGLIERDRRHTVF